MNPPSLRTMRPRQSWPLCGPLESLRMERRKERLQWRRLGVYWRVAGEGKTGILAVIADGQEAKTGILAYGPEGRMTAPSRAWGITKEFNMRRGVLIAFTAALAIWLIGCQQAPPVAAKPDLKAEEAKIMEADAAWL